MNEMGNNGFERLNALGKLNLRTWEKVVTGQMDAVSLAMEQGIHQVKLATEAKSYTEYLKGQVELATQISARAMEQAKANLKVAGEVQEDYRAWMQTGMSMYSDVMNRSASSSKVLRSLRYGLVETARKTGSRPGSAGNDCAQHWQQLGEPRPRPPRSSRWPAARRP
ncbi:MAG: phasin family protein [Arenicellales bacterium]